MRALPLCALPFLLIACGGGSAPPAKAPADDDKPEKARPKAKDEKSKSEAPEAEASGMPTKCAGSGEACTPPIKFVKRL